jgi:hypothetical protein
MSSFRETWDWLELVVPPVLLFYLKQQNQAIAWKADVNKIHWDDLLKEIGQAFLL